MRENTRGMISWVAPPPRFPQPPENPLAEPTTGAENIELIQNCVDTKVASEKPVKNRTRRYEVAELMMEVKYTNGAVRRIIEAEARRGPTKSQAVPIATLAKTAPDTDATPAFPMSVAVRLRLSRIIGRRGGAAKLDTKHEKKEIHDK